MTPLTPDMCDCDTPPLRGPEAGKHLSCCRYGIIEDWLEAQDARGLSMPVLGGLLRIYDVAADRPDIRAVVTAILAGVAP